MSDYYGDATLEDWLAEEVFSASQPLPKSVISLFEQWRTDVERNIESWMDSDDGFGNRLSWRGWGRGFAAISDTTCFEFEEAIQAGRVLLNPTPEAERAEGAND